MTGTTRQETPQRKSRSAARPFFFGKTGRSLPTHLIAASVKTLIARNVGAD